MASQDLIRMLNRCITDKKFCQLLLAQPQEAIQTYQLEEAEREVLLSISTDNFIWLVTRLNELGLVSERVGHNREPAQNPHYGQIE